jgi:hypothetical protein
MKKIKMKISILLAIFMCALMSSCNTMEKRFIEQVLNEMPEEYVLEHYNEYLPSKFKCYYKTHYYFEATYETDSNLMTIEKPKKHPYHNSLEFLYGDDWYIHTIASKYNVKFSNERQEVPVKCTYYDKDNDITFVVNRTFIIQTADEYILSSLNRSTTLSSWVYENGIYSIDTWKKTTTEISSSYKITTTTDYKITYNRETGDIYYETHSNVLESKGYENIKSSYDVNHTFNIKTRRHLANGEEAPEPTGNSILSKIIKVIDEIDSLIQ